MAALFLADGGNVVLRLARDDAGVAADARGLVDLHRPLEPARIIPAAFFGRGIHGVERDAAGLFFFDEFVFLDPLFLHLDFAAEAGGPMCFWLGMPLICGVSWL